MNNILKNIFIFSIGAGVGAAVAVKLVKDKYEKIAQEEIDSVKEMVNRRASTPITPNGSGGEFDGDPLIINDTEPVVTKKPSIKEVSKKYVKKINQENGYTDYSNSDDDYDDRLKEEDVIVYPEHPYVIDVDEYGEEYDYDKIILTYYADDILADELDEVINDVDDMVGVDSLSIFAEQDEDSVYVRNDRLRVDYEILYDNRNYSDVMRKPHQMED